MKKEKKEDRSIIDSSGAMGRDTFEKSNEKELRKCKFAARG